MNQSTIRIMTHNLWKNDANRPDKFELVDSDFFIYPESIPGYEGCFNNDKTKFS